VDLVERYIYAVTKRLPINQREEIEKELKGLIEDMLAERARHQEPSQSEIEAVLLGLGEPSALADQYRGKKRFLIGPANFDHYLFVLKIVVTAVGFGLTLALIIGNVVNPPQNVLAAMGSYVAAMIAAIIQGFAWVTAIFAIIEHCGVSVIKLPRDKIWSPLDLPQIPVKETRIKPIEPILGIAFAVFMIILFNSANQLIGAYVAGSDSSVTVIPLFNEETFRGFLIFFNLLFSLGIVKECIKLVIGRWTIGLAAINAVVNVISLIVFVYIFSNHAI